MKKVSTSETEWIPYPGQRVTVTRQRPLLQGASGAADNYDLYITNYGPGGSQSPRHRHNFDQFRWAIDQPLNYGPDQNIPSGQLAYFPEGAYYGPMYSVEGNQMLILQFGGASGQGYMTNADLQRGTSELKQKGEFVRGIYTWFDESGKKHNKDAYEAAWEQVNGRELNYPLPRYQSPILINPAAFEWVPVDGAPGASRKMLGVFNERNTYAEMLRLTPGAAYVRDAGPQVNLFFVVSGALEIGRDEFGQRHDAFSLDAGESVALKALAETVLLVFGMPAFAEKRARQSRERETAMP